MHQHRSMLKLMPCFLLYFRSFVTSSVFTRVTIGIGDDIQRLNASRRLLSCGLISVFIVSIRVIVGMLLDRVVGDYLAVVVEGNDEYH